MIEGMPSWFWILSLVLFGVMAGSFAGAQVWRLRARQLRDDKAELKRLRAKGKIKRSSREEQEYLFLKEQTAMVTDDEYRSLSTLNVASLTQDRSRCLNCQHVLAWYDLVPIMSWLSVGGRCRYCRQPIGWFELGIELAMAVFFVGSFLLWPFELQTSLEVAAFVIWLAASVPLAILFSYDAKWFLLPNRPMIVFIALAALFAFLRLMSEEVTISSIVSLLGAIASISGLYWVLHAVSRGRWVGFGDVTLGIGLGLLLGRWELGIVAVFLANLIGTMVVLPGLIRSTLERGSHMPFGPLLILGMLGSFFWGQNIIDWYLSIL